MDLILSDAGRRVTLRGTAQSILVIVKWNSLDYVTLGPTKTVPELALTPLPQDRVKAPLCSVCSNAPSYLHSPRQFLGEIKY